MVRDQGVTPDTGTLALSIGRGGNSKDPSTVSQLKVTPLGQSGCKILWDLKRQLWDRKRMIFFLKLAQYYFRSQITISINGKSIKSLQLPYSLRRQVLQRERFVLISFVMWKENSADEFSLRKSPHRCTLNYCHEDCCLDLELLWFHCLYSTAKMSESVQHQLETCACQYQRWYRAPPPRHAQGLPTLASNKSTNV